VFQFRDQKCDCYARVALSQHYRTVKVKRTATVKGTDCPNFSECFNFRVPAAQVDVTSVSVQILQAVSGYGRGELLHTSASGPVSQSAPRRRCESRLISLGLWLNKTNSVGLSPQANYTD
jgi:hypothetical protein